MNISIKQFLSDLNAMNSTIETEDIALARLGMSDKTFWQLEDEDIQSYFDGKFSDTMNLWLLDNIERVVDERGNDAGRRVMENLSTSNEIDLGMTEKRRKEIASLCAWIGGE